MATKLLPLLLLAQPSLGQTVTITQDIPFTGHDCVEDCLYRPYAAPIDLGDALECGPPYEEDCYCVTAAPQATIVSRHINDCASESCSRGDLTKDIESMKYYYAGYCVENGYTADLIEEWYSSAEVAETDSVTDEDAATTQTSEGETTATTATSTTEEEEESTITEEASSTEETETVAASTRTSVVTQTAGSDEDEGGRGLPDFDFEGDDEDDGVVDVTSTVWINSEGSQVVNPPGGSGSDDGGSGVNVVALGVGLGVGIPLVLAGLGVGIWLCLRQRRRSQQALVHDPAAPSPHHPQSPPPEHPSPPYAAVSPVLQTEKQELHGVNVTREIYGTEIHPLPDNSPSPPVALEGRYEMPGESRPQEMDASRYKSPYNPSGNWT